MASNIQPTGLDWKNLPDKTTPLSAENLNKMAHTIDDLVEAVNPLNTVEANPTGTPTEGLEKVEIDGTLYEVKGGHKILNDSGTTLTQKDNLQFKGTYVEDDQTNNKTVVNVTRQMTLAEFNQLTAEQKKGIIDVTDQQGHPITASDIPYDSNTSVKDKIDDISNAVNSVSIVSETSVTTSINDTAYLYKLSNGVKVISYNSSSIQGTEHNNLFSIPAGYEPTVNKNHYFTGLTDNAKLRICKLSNGSVSVYAQEANDRGFYVSMIYS